MNKFRVSPQFRPGQSGQGVVEYILLLVVVITIATVFMNMFAKPYAKWAQQHIGDYVECLLNYGELPGTAIQDCEQPDFEQVAAPASASKSGGGNQANDSSSHNNSAAQNGGAGRATLASENGRNFQKLGTGGMDGSGGRKEIPVGTEEQKSANGLMRFGGTRSPIRARQGEGNGGKFMQGLLAAEAEKIKKRQEKAQKVANAEAGENGGRQAKKFALEPHIRKAASTDISDDGWSFGKLFRILLIICILIAIILFIAGQLVQISKSMEK